MILTHSTSTKSIFLLGTISTTLLILLVNNWVIMWLCIELNLIFLIPILIKMEGIRKLETRIKYFLFQSIGSHMFIITMVWAEISIILRKNLLITATIIKLGGAPCHQWFPPLINSQPWVVILILSTSQKLPLLLILTLILVDWDTKIITILITLNVIVGRLGGLNQSQLKPLLAYSSINNVGWLLLGRLIGRETTIIYFIVYSWGVGIVIWNFHYLNKSNLKLSQQLKSSWNSLTLRVLFIMSLWGRPPFIGFAPKIIMLSYLTNPLHILRSILVLSSMVRLFYYGIIFLITIIKHINEKTVTHSSSNQLSIAMILLSSPLLALLLIQ